MSLGLAAVGVGGLLGGLLGSRKQKVSQSSTRQILPRDYSASLLWDTYMNRLLGDAAYPLIQFNAGGYPAQVSVASLLDKLAGVKQVDPTVTLYTKYYAQPLLLHKLVGSSPLYEEAMRIGLPAEAAKRRWEYIRTYGIEPISTGG